ncbi:MAG: valine--tRNA ligase [Bacilli bacterium]
MLEQRYNFKVVEEGKYETWKSAGYFTAGDISKEKFSMVIPPPNVTGKLHIGHAYDTTIQDIIARYKKAKGFDVLWLPGTDHAGIATEAKVVKRLKDEGISRYDIGREKFLEAAWNWKKEYSDSIHEQWSKMGLMLDYTRERFTLDEGLNKAVNYVFKKLYDEGLIYRGERIINWDPVQKTALSNIEVIHKDIKGKFYYFKYKIVDSDDVLVVATTRPETMFGDVCLNVNPKDERYKKYVGKYAINPANHEKLIIIADDYVDISFGTGVMKCTPAHDPNDFIIGKKYHLPVIVCMDNEAKMNEIAGIYNGLDRFVCREKLVEQIKKEDNLVKIENIVHNVGHSERSNAIVEPYLSKQWFVNMKKLSEACLDLQKSEDKISFIPNRFNKTFTQWMENCEDWCISRQLWWGHRIPAYYSKLDNSILVSETAPTDIENYTQDEDVLDTWFSSALWPFSTLGWPEQTEDFKRYFPLDVMVTAYDIIFFWVSRMIFQGLHFTNQKPFKSVLIHGLIRAEDGRKMSKSLGNGIDPLEVIDTYGVDSLRYFLATCSTPGLDMRYNKQKVESSSNFLNKIWNVSRFILLNLDGYVSGDISNKELTAPDKYILNKLEETIKKVTSNMDKYELGNASTCLYNFVYDDFCSYYIELSKSVLYSKTSSRLNTQRVLLKVLSSIIMMIYPYSPFISEEIYLSLPDHKSSIMLESYPIFEKKFVFKKEVGQVELLKEMIKDIRNFKVKNNLAPNAKVDLVVVSKEILFNEFEDLLKRFAFAESINIIDSFNDNSYEIYVYSDKQLLIKSNVCKEELIAKLNNDLAFENSEIERSEKMLNNQNFISKAPKEKLDAEKKKYEEHLLARKIIEEKIKNI